MIFGSEILYSARLGDADRGFGEAGNDLDQFEQLHLIDRVRQHFRGRGLREDVHMGVHQGIPHGGPVVKPMILIAGPASSLSSRTFSAGRRQLSTF